VHRAIAFLFLLIAASFAAASQAQSTGTLVVVANAHGAYCSGAAPPAGMLEAIQRPRPVAGNWLVRPGRQNAGVQPVAIVHTDASGTGQVALPPGTYCVVSEAKRAPPPHRPTPNVDPVCLRQLFRQCDAVAVVTVGAPTRVTIDHYDTCSWQQAACSTLPPGPPPP